MMRLIFVFLSTAVFSFNAHANICGTDFQNFNPTTNGLDFVTVHSSETLKPCVLNVGLFFNYAANSLTYTSTVAGTAVEGRKRNDRILGADLNAGMGITKYWDVGFSLPMILHQEVADGYSVAEFDKSGVTEFKLNTKYRLMGNESRGLAAVLSLNQNLIEDNPFTGRNPGPTWNLELAADTTIASKWAVAVNGGYRKRDQGKPINGVPFVPMDDQWIYSTAASYLVTKWDTKVIFELFGSQAAKKVERGTERGLTSLEALIGFKHDYSHNLALHVGYGHQMDAALGGADWRVYTGVNWAMGPLCNTQPPVVEPAPLPPEPVVQSQNLPTPEVYTLNVELLFAHNSDKLDMPNLGPLDEFVKGLIAEGFDRLAVEGHTDSTGHPDYNMDLSLRRANGVKKYLVEKHKVAAEKIITEGFGMTKPMADNGNFQGRQKNRRVEFKVWRNLIPKN